MNPATEPSAAPRSWLLITNARSASNLFAQLLFENKKNVHHTHYAFLEALLTASTYVSVPISELDEEQRVKFLTAVEDGRRKIKQNFADAYAAGKIGGHKEHAVSMLPAAVQHEEWRIFDEIWRSQDQSMSVPATLHQPVPYNPTCLDDAFLKSVHPVFLIRHPALAMPSFWRILRQPDKMYQGTLKHSRDLFDYYKYHHTKDSTWPAPILIESSDLANNFAVVERLAATIGIDPQTVPRAWDKPSEEEYNAWPPVRKLMCATLATSTGIESQKLPTSVDIEKEIKAWKTEFGDDIARKLEICTRREMPDYEYLLQHKLV